MTAYSPLATGPASTPKDESVQLQVQVQGAGLLDRPLRSPVQVRVVDGLVRTGRTMTSQAIITIDGPAATGKTSVAHGVAKALGFDFLDTGAMYRAAALLALESGLVKPGQVNGYDRAVQDGLIGVVERTAMAFDWSKDPPALTCNGRDVMERIRDDDVTGIVSPIAGISALRAIMVAKQRQIAVDHPRLVTEGRDQGAIVFPGAPVKFFLDADPMIRAKRRRDQMLCRRNHLGTSEPVPTLATIAQQLLDRDAADASAGRLLRPGDAIVVDTSALNFQQVVDCLVEHARRLLD